MKTDEELVLEATELLKQARYLLVQAQCPKAAQKVRLAISSARGAATNARYRKYRNGELSWLASSSP